MKKAVYIILLIIFCFNSNALANEKVRIQLVWYHQFQFAGYYMALEKGYYNDEGLDVDILPVNVDSSPIEEVLKGNAEFGISTSGVLLDYINGSPLVSVAAIFQRSPLVFVTKARDDITSIRDFLDKRVMMLEDRSSLELAALLKKYGLYDYVDRTPSSFDIEDLINDETDVFNGYKSNEPYLMEIRGVSSRIFDPYEYGIKFYGDLLFTNKNYLKDNKTTVEAFRRASLKGWKYAMSHTEETIDIIKNVYKSEKTKAHLRFEASIIQELTQHDIVPLGFQSEERWQQIVSILHSMGIVDSKINLKDFIYEPPIKIRWKEMRPFFLFFTIIVLLIILWRYYTLYTANRTITEKERLILQQSKYVALGEMMGAITHQLKQPLTATSMILQNLEDSVHKENDLKMIDQGIDLIDHMAETIDGFRNFYKADRVQDHFSVTEAIKDAFELSKGYLAHNNIDYELLCSCWERDYPHSPDECGNIKSNCSTTLYGNSNEFKQIMMNLIQNSREALIDSEKEEKKIRVNISRKKDVVEIIFEDNGPGICPSVLDKLFDMDVTSKEDGTGLGLYMCRKMIKQYYDGYIKAENYLDGARFIIYLPV